MGMATATSTSQQSETGHLIARDGGQDEASDDAAATADNCEETLDLEDVKIASNDNSKKKKAKKKKKKKQQHKSNSSGAGGRGQVMPTQALVDALFPWTAANKPKVGRCAIAERAIKAGEVVVAEHAVAFVPRSQNRPSVCDSCCRNLSPPVPTFECPDCKYSVFCEDCEVLATERHKILCRVSSRIKEIAQASDCDEDLLHLVLELALQHQRNSEISGSLENNGYLRAGAVKDGIIYSSYEDAICLKTHIDKVATEWKTSVKKGCQLLYDELAAVRENDSDKLTFGVDTLQNLAALINTNSHGMGVSGSGIHDMDLAVGIFPFVSMLNHSCRPNCCFSSDGRVMYVRAVQDIPKGTELCLSYINLYEPRGVRKIQLAATKHFICCCQRCSEPFASSMDRLLEGCMCPVRGCGGVVVKASSLHEIEMSASGNSLPSSWECDQCSRIIDPNVLGTKLGALGEYPWVLVAKAERKLAEAMSVYRERRFKEARLLLEQYVDEFTGKLHPLNVLLFDALTPLMNCCRALGDAAEGSRVCQNILNSMEKVVSGYSLELANFYFCLGEMFKERSESSKSNVMMKHYRKLAQESFQHVRTIRKACLGNASLPE